MSLARLNALLSALSVLGSSALASAGDKALAEALFTQAAQLMDAGQTAQACEKFQASNAQDPSSGTALNLARCWAQLGRTASAWAQYQEAARIAGVQGRQDRVDEARARAEELKPQLSHVTVLVPTSPAGITITRNDVELPPAAWGTPLPTDPGLVVIVATANGYQTRRLEITLQPKSSQTIQVPPLEVDAARKPAPAPQAEPKPALSSLPPRSATPKPASSHAPNRTPAYLVGGTGLLFIAAGSVFGVLSKSSYDEARSLCGNRTSNCPQAALDERDRVDLFANLANAGFGLGLVAVGVGSYLFFSAPGGADVRASSQLVPVLGPEVGGAIFTRSF